MSHPLIDGPDRGDIAGSPYAEHVAADDRELSAIRLVEALLAADDVVEPHRRELLSIAVWKYTEARAGKYALRYRTPAALAADAGAKLQHEHVHTRKVIVAQLVEAGAALAPLVLSRAVGCVVTADEHAVLSAVPGHLQGWSRYSAAGLTVVDTATGVTRDPEDLEEAYGSLDVAEARELVRGGPERLCLLAACRLLEPDTAPDEAVTLAVRDAECIEGWWLHRRLAQRTGHGGSGTTADWAAALTEAGRRFRSPALRAAGDLLQRRPAGGLDVAGRRALAAELAEAAGLERTGPADPAAAPLARASVLAADRPDVPQWHELVGEAAGGRYLPLVSEADGGARESMRRIARLYGDPVLDLALTLFEKRARLALRERPPAEVVDWVLSRCQ